MANKTEFDLFLESLGMDRSNLPKGPVRTGNELRDIERLRSKAEGSPRGIRQGMSAQDLAMAKEAYGGIETEGKTARLAQQSGNVTGGQSWDYNISDTGASDPTRFFRPFSGPTVPSEPEQELRGDTGGGEGGYGTDGNYGPQFADEDLNALYNAAVSSIPGEFAAEQTVPLGISGILGTLAGAPLDLALKSAIGPWGTVASALKKGLNARQAFNRVSTLGDIRQNNPDAFGALTDELHDNPDAQRSLANLTGDPLGDLAESAAWNAAAKNPEEAEAQKPGLTDFGKMASEDLVNQFGDLTPSKFRDVIELYSKSPSGNAPAPTPTTNDDTVNVLSNYMSPITNAIQQGLAGNWDALSDLMGGMSDEEANRATNVRNWGRDRMGRTSYEGLTDADFGMEYGSVWDTNRTVSYNDPRHSSNRNPIGPTTGDWSGVNDPGTPSTTGSGDTGGKGGAGSRSGSRGRGGGSDSAGPAG